MADPPAPADDSLRWTFVEMLFALAVSQVAINVADLISLGDPLMKKMPAFAHLTVAFVLIATSWLGWRRSRSPGMLESLEYVFSLRFLALLADMLLVVVYFIIARGAEIEQKGGETKLADVVSARPESIGLCVVFGVYAFWDLATDVFPRGCIPPAPGRLWTGLKAAFVSMFASVVCLVFVGFIVFAFATTTAGRCEVLFLDGALLCVILLFRELKAIENPLAKWLTLKACRAWIEVRPTHGHELTTAIGLTLSYLAFLVAAWMTAAS